MYKNYGDVNFLEYGLLIEEQSENQINFIVCRPFSDCENAICGGRRCSRVYGRLWQLL